MLQPRPPCQLPLAVIISQGSGRHSLIRRTIPFMHCLRRFSSTPSPLAKSSKEETPMVERLVEIPEDIGYIEMIITPTRKGTKDVPPFWKAPRLWRRLYSAKFGIWDMNKTQMNGFDARHPHHHFDRRDFEKYTLALYKQMNTAFAGGNNPKDIKTIKSICGANFAQSLISAIEGRDDKQKMTWKWEKELSRPKLVSFICEPLIKRQPESDLVQTIVRIHGQETLSDGVSEPKTHESYTYLVLHNKMWVRPFTWQIIGRIEETPLDKFKALMEMRIEQMKEMKKKKGQLQPRGIFKRTWEDYIAPYIYIGGLSSRKGGGARPVIPYRPPPEKE